MDVLFWLIYGSVALNQAVSTTRLPPTRVQMGKALLGVSQNAWGAGLLWWYLYGTPDMFAFRLVSPRNPPKVSLNVFETFMGERKRTEFPLFGHQVSAKTRGTPPSRPVGVMQGPRPKNTTHNGHVHEFGTSIQMGTSPDCRASGKSPPQMDHALDVLAEPHLKQVAPVGKLAKHLTGLLPFDPTLPVEGNQSKPHFSPWVLIICERLG